MVTLWLPTPHKHRNSPRDPHILSTIKGKIRLEHPAFMLSDRLMMQQNHIENWTYGRGPLRIEIKKIVL